LCACCRQKRWWRAGSTTPRNCRSKSPTEVGRLLCLIVYIAMMVGGVLTLILQLVYSPVLSFKFAAGSVAVAVFGAYLLWEDFLR
jgi:hypothetical protein